MRLLPICCRLFFRSVTDSIEELGSVGARLGIAVWCGNKIPRVKAVQRDHLHERDKLVYEFMAKLRRQQVCGRDSTSLHVMLHHAAVVGVLHHLRCLAFLHHACCLLHCSIVGQAQVIPEPEHNPVTCHHRSGGAESPLMAPVLRQSRTEWHSLQKQATALHTIFRPSAFQGSCPMSTRRTKRSMDSLDLQVVVWSTSGL